MCDCYTALCEVCGMQGGGVEMHIGDFLYPREDFKVWCHKHIDEAPVGATICEWGEYEPTMGRCAIVGPALDPDGDNGPNFSGPVRTRLKG